METLGTVASIIQLVDTALKVRDYVQDFRHAPQEQQKLVSEMGYLRPLLEELQVRIQNNPSSSIVQQMKKPLTTFQATMEHLATKLQPAGGRLAKVSKQIAWSMGDKKDAKEYLEKFEQFKSLLNGWLLMDIWDAGQQQRRDHGAIFKYVDDAGQQQRRDHGAILKSVEDVGQQQRRDHGAILESVEDAARQQKRAHDQFLTTIEDYALDQQSQIDAERRTQIIDWLSINFFQRQADILRSRQPGTGDWLLEDFRFKRWETGPGEILWCYGMPGAGKTVLASVVVDHLERRYQGKNVAVACIYLNHKETDTQTVSNLLASVWRQLAAGKRMSSTAEELYQRHSEKRTRPTLNETRDVLHAEVTQWSKVYVVVDALDEYPEDERNILLEHLTTLGPAVGLLLTSRPHISLHHSLPTFGALEIRATEEDIQKYVDDRIRTSSRLLMHVRTRPDLREEIQSKIKGSVDGMFLLAKLHIESLATKSTIRALRLALENLPKDLEHTYDEAMERIDRQNEDDRKIAHSALTWVANAKRILSVYELQDALAVEPGAKRLNPDNFLEIDIILSVCAGLIIADASSSDVRLVHHTTQHYLDGIRHRLFPEAHKEITFALLTYLAFNAFDAPDSQWRGSDYPLLDYCHYCFLHAVGEPEVSLQDMIVTFLERVSRWKSYYGTWSKIAPWNYPDWPSSVSPLWIAASANLQEITQHLLDGRILHPHSPSPSSHIAIPPTLFAEGESTILHVASYYGHFQMSQLLVEKGVDVNQEEGVYGCALQAASHQGHDSVVSLLLNNGADANAKGGCYGSALQVAAYTGHEGVVRLLVDAGAAIDSGMPVETCHLDCEWDDGALHAAVCGGRRDIVLLLIEKGGDMNADSRGDGAFWSAVLHRYQDIVRLLIEKGYDVSSNPSGDAAFNLAVFRGDEGIVRLLLETGYNVISNHTAFNAAIDEGHKDIVGLFIEKGCDMGWALERASSQGNEDIVRLLIKKGVDVNEHGGRALQAAWTSSNSKLMDVINLLLSHGANPSIVGQEDVGNALVAVSIRGYQDTVRFLIEKGADVNAPGGQYGSALQAASSHGHEAIVRQLIEKGANIKKHGGSAIQAAWLGTNQGIINLLVEHGANLARILWQEDVDNALVAASIRGYQDTVRLLIEKGADVNAPDKKYGSALQAASYHGYKGITRLLIEKGADVNQQGGLHGSALGAAADQGHKSIVRLLLELGVDVDTAQGQGHNIAQLLRLTEE
ncbi:ankyrin repeat-containing domain protein [Mycena vulgaris]|nr:ankyrin repeat-containing domain protein [Mycena vulgaris]